MKKNTGFTLIELLVVIAIIGILSSVVLASLNTARAKGADAAVKSDLNNTRAQAALYYDGLSPYTYLGVCAAATSANGIVAGVLAAAKASGSTVVLQGTAGDSTHTACHDLAGGYAAEAPLKSVTSSYFCVDSSGAAITTTTALAATAITCS